MKILHVFVIVSIFVLATAQVYRDEYDNDDPASPFVRGIFTNSEEVENVEKSTPDIYEFPENKPKKSRGSNKIATQNSGRLSRLISSKSSAMELIKRLTHTFTFVLEVSKNHTIKGINNIIDNINNHENGLINVKARTKIGRFVGKAVERILKMFYIQNWTGVFGHLVQETTDLLIETGKDLLSHITSLKAESQEIVDSSTTESSFVDISEDFEQYAISEYEDPTTHSYHCTVRNTNRNTTFIPDPEILKYLDSNGLLSIRPKKHYYQVRQVRQKMCQFGFDPFRIEKKPGSIHKRYKNNLRLMIYNTPGLFPNLKVVRNDLDRKRKREPQIWLKFEATSGPMMAEFDYDNYFCIISGDLARIQAFSKMLVAVKLHKRLNNFKDAVSYKINLDLGIIDVILSTFGFWMMRDRSMTSLMINALNGIRTSVTDTDDVKLEFEESLKEATDKLDPNLYSYIWLLSMAEKFEIIRIGNNAQSKQNITLELNQKKLKRKTKL